MNILTPAWSPKVQGGYLYGVDWLHPITNALSYINVTNNLTGAPTYSRFGQGTYANTTCSLAPDSGGIGIKGSATSSKLKWTGRGPTTNTAGTVLAYATCGATAVNRFLFRLDDGAEANSLLWFMPVAANIGYGWYTGSGAQLYKSSALLPTVGRPSVLGLTWNTASPFQNCWCDGAVSSNTDAFNKVDTSNYNLNLGNSNTTNLSWLDNANSRIYWIAFWDRVLSNSEIIYLNTNPMCFLLPAEDELPMLTRPPGFFQKHFRFRSDADAVDATPTWGASEDVS